MNTTDNIEIWNPDKIFSALSIGSDIVVFYLMESAATKGFQVKTLAKDLELENASITELLEDNTSIAVYAGTATDVNSLVVILSAYPYNELVYFAHYCDGKLMDENIPSEMDVSGKEVEEGK